VCRGGRGGCGGCGGCGLRVVGAGCWVRMSGGVWWSGGVIAGGGEMRRWSRTFGGTNAFLGAGLEAGQLLRVKWREEILAHFCTALSLAGVGGCQFV
jgi:hypothetical protein